MDACLKDSEWLAGPSYSVADIDTFANAYALPVSQPQAANKDIAPHYWDWLRRIYTRPAIRKAFEPGRTPLAARALEMIREFAA